MTELSTRLHDRARAAGWDVRPDSEQAVFSVTVTMNGTGARLAIAGELDFAASPKLCDLVAALAEMSCEQVTVDLAGLEFIDGAGISALAQMRRGLEAAGIAMYVQNMSRQAIAVARLLGEGMEILAIVSHDG